MKVDKSKIDYDMLLDDWAEIVITEADRYMSLSETAEVGSYRSGFYDGMYRGHVDALDRLILLKNRKKYKEEIKNDGK